MPLASIVKNTFFGNSGGSLTPAVKAADRPRSGNTGVSNGNSFGNIISGGLGVITSILQNAANRRFAREQADLAYKRQVEQWNRENAYNTPAAMVARLKAAGLNVNDAFSGQGALPAGGLSSVDQANYSPMDVASSMASAIGSAASWRNSATSESRARVQNAVDIESIEQIKANVQYTSLDSRYKQVLLRYLDRSEQLRLSSLGEQIILTRSQRRYVDEQVKYYAAEIVSLIRNRNASTEQLEKTLEQLESAILRDKSIAALNFKQTEYVKGVAIANAISNAVGEVVGAVVDVGNTVKGRHPRGYMMTDYGYLNF